MEIDDFVRPIHYSVWEFFTSPSQLEIDSIYAHLLFGVDASQVGFAHPPQIECDYIRKNICFESDQCEAEIIIACVSYLTSEDVLADLSAGPCQFKYNLENRIRGNELLRYCSTHFDKHIIFHGPPALLTPFSPGLLSHPLGPFLLPCFAQISKLPARTLFCFRNCVGCASGRIRC